MADFYHIHGEELDEVMISSKGFFEKTQAQKSFITKSSNRYGNFSIVAVPLNNIHVSNFKMNFNENVIITDQLLSSVGLEINKKGYTYHSLDIKQPKTYKFDNNHCALHFANGNTTVQSIYTKGIEAEYLYIQFSPFFIKTLVQLYPENLELCYKRYENGENFMLNDTTLPITADMKQIISQIENFNLLGKSNTMFVEAKVIELLALQFEFFKHKKTRQERNKSIKNISDKEKIHEARGILLNDLHQTPSLQQLSLQVGINEKKLKQGFKEVFGTTVFGYLFQHKMSLAQQYLLDTNLPINEIAFICGYEYVSHFSSAFKRYWGCSPMEFRHRESNENTHL